MFDSVMTLAQQYPLWTVWYIVFAVVCFLRLLRHADQASTEPFDAPTRERFGSFGFLGLFSLLLVSITAFVFYGIVAVALY